MKTRVRKTTECHPDKFHYAKGLCKNCYFNKYVQDRPEFKKKMKEYTSNWNKNVTTKERRKYALKYKYGISQEIYDEMLEAQNGKCAICLNSPKSGRILCVDHCHRTGKVRKLLCSPCNTYLGKVENDTSVLERIGQYLRNDLDDRKV